MLEFNTVSTEATRRNPRHELKELFPKYFLIIATDLEGPQLLGDTTYELMKKYIRPDDQRHNNNIDYGGIYITKPIIGMRAG